MTEGADGTPTDSKHGFHAVPVGEVELTVPGSVDVAPRNAVGETSLLVRLHGLPLGVLHLIGDDALSAGDLRQRIHSAFAADAMAHLAGDGVPAADSQTAWADAADIACKFRLEPPAQSATVAVCTLGADRRLLDTVISILAQTHPDFELLVVDNRPESGGVRDILDGIVDSRLRILAEPRRGLSAARNAALAAARGAFIAFTDDDAAADRDWLARLLGPFGMSPDVAATTGLVLPASLDTPAQLLFEEFGAFDKGFHRTIWGGRQRPDEELARLGRPGARDGLFPYSAGVFGSGNNMAFRTEWARRHGLFDEALGAGTLTRGGEDLDAFLTVMLTGNLLVYEPQALVRHHARSDLDGFRQQLYGYGSGMAAVILKHALASPGQAVAIAGRLPAGLRKLLSPSSDKNVTRSAAFPPELARTELRGYLAGPVLYARARRRARSGRSSRLP